MHEHTGFMTTHGDLNSFVGTGAIRCPPNVLRTYRAGRQTMHVVYERRRRLLRDLFFCGLRPNPVATTEDGVFVFFRGRRTPASVYCHRAVHQTGLRCFCGFRRESERSEELSHASGVLAITLCGRTRRPRGDRASGWSPPMVFGLTSSKTGRSRLGRTAPDRCLIPVQYDPIGILGLMRGVANAR